MPQPLDILDERDPLARSFAGALAIHGCAVALLFFGWFWANRPKQMLGDPHPAGGPAYSVSPVHNIPIPKREAPANPVANDTQSSVPTAPAKQEVEKTPPPPQKDAFELPEKIKREAERPQQQRKYTQLAPQNQVYSRSPQALSNPMYGAQSGAGQVGIGPNSPLGYRLGAYAELIRQRIAEKWQTSGLDAHSQSSPAVVSFDISRDGGIRSPKIVQSSGNPTIDNTALRAVYDASPLPPLPPQITESSISAQFTFNLR